MAYLITHHDPYHVHKIVGLLCLLHFVYRFFMIVLHGTAFPDSESCRSQAACVLVHAVLSWSALLLPLPEKRNFNSPMIWPEFRLHSITFATRHVVATAVTLLGLWPESVVADVAVKTALVVCTVLAARVVTTKYGDREKRTTNAMPYPPKVCALFASL
jgi:hypothetical protein